MVVEIGHCLHYQNVVSLVKRVDKGIDALDYLKHEILVDSVFEATVVIKDTGKLSDIRSH